MIRKVSKKQVIKNSKLAKIKKEMGKVCYFCGGYGNDLAHILCKGIFHQYYTEKWNLIIACRTCHIHYDTDKEFRRKQVKLFEQVMSNAKEEDKGYIKKYFGR